MSDFAALGIANQAVLVLASLVLFTAFALLGQTRMFSLIRVLAWQGGLLALTTGLVAFTSGQAHLYFSAALTFVLKALVIPWMLRFLVRRLDVRHEIETIWHPAAVLLGAAALVVFSYWVALPIVSLSDVVTRNTIAVSLAVVLLGTLLMVSRRQAVSQVVGFMAIENGLFFAAVAATFGMPMVIELGVAFDVLVAAILFGVFFLQLRDTIDSLDVDRLNLLREPLE